MASEQIKSAEVPEAMGDAEAKKVLLASDLYDMHKHVGWYSAPEKNFKEKGVALILSVAAARDAQWQSTRLRGGVPDGKQQQAWRCEHFFNLRSRVLTAPNGREYELLDDDIRNPRVAAFLGVLLDAVLTAAPQAPAAALDAGVVRDAERYRVLRCYELRGSWPEGLGKAPAGLLAFSSLTMSELDRALDDMLGHLPRANVRADYQSWMRATTQERIAAAMSAQAGTGGA